jgi:hypothetical protein
MPILLWYLPLTMFYGTCDLLFAGLEMQVNEDRRADLDQPKPEEEAPQHCVSRRRPELSETDTFPAANAPSICFRD